jgi:multimeric flavodoxin WrbA
MNLLIHDLGEKEWEIVKDEYREWEVVDANGSIRPCTGCFCCWCKTPGECIVKDGYDRMGEKIHHADSVTVISRYSYGGFSGKVKNVFDRRLGYVLPQFEITAGETHHKRRYEEDKEFTFIFYGHGLSEEEKASARQYVEAVCANVRGHVKEVIFREAEEKDALKGQQHGEFLPGKTVILNGSMRGMAGNSGKLAGKLISRLTAQPDIIELRQYINDLGSLVRQLEDYSTLLLCMPLYVDGMPSQVIRLFETFEKEYRGGKKHIYLLSNMGLYESSQLRNLFGAVKQWCRIMDFDYCGGVGASAGELIGVLMQHLPFRVGFTRNISRGIDRLAEAMNRGAVIEDIFAEPFLFPRLLFMFIANYSWDVNARNNGIKPADLYRRL